MKITKVQFHFMEGLTPAGNNNMLSSAKRHADPTDIYSGFVRKYDRTAGTRAKDAGNGQKKVTQAYLEIETNEGITGLVGPVSPEVRAAISTKYGKVIMGEDPLNTEYLWDIMYRTSPDSFAGTDMRAISAVDIALWDIKAKAANMPLYKLIGGASQPEMPAYFNCGKYSMNTDPEKIAETVRMVKDLGYKALKWYAPAGPGQGKEGIRKNVDALCAVREAAGPDFDIMVDCSCAWDYDYTLKMLPLLEPVDLLFLEEPLMPMMIESYGRLNSISPIPIALGQRLYNRWGFKPFLDADAAEYYQPEPYFCGGVTEAVKIATLCVCYGKKVSFHGSIPPVMVQLSAALSPAESFLAEHMDFLMHTYHLFYKTPFFPENGHFKLPDTPGIGIIYDQNKIINEWYED